MYVDLSTRTVSQLRDIAKDNGISGRWKMSRQDLIEALDGVGIKDLSTKPPVGYEAKHKEDIKQNPETSYRGSDNPKTNNKGLVVGALAAFKYEAKGQQRVLSGKVSNITEDKVELKTKMGSIFTVPKTSILCVKEGQAWPRWVLELFNPKKKAGDKNAIS